MQASVIFSLATMLAGVSGKSLTTVPKPAPTNSLIAAIQGNMDNILMAQDTATNEVTTEAPPLPGRMNICDYMCPKWCEKVANSGNYTHCHYVCGDICNSETSTNNPYIGNFQFEVVPSDFNFKTYDVNGDKRISVEEFAVQEQVPTADVSKMFKFADFNGDGFIDTEEFMSGPFVFTVQMAAELNSVVSSAKRQQ